MEKRDSRYLVSITGANTHFECPINTLSDFEDLENILRIMKKKIQGI
ncbi:Uncharacterised protein [uncultured archaeon]|nr:Uncharacterised protein [uncultured archaeon]